MNSKIKPITPSTTHISFLLTSESGWGKTVFAGTHPKMLILSSDPEGVDSAAFQGTQAKVWFVRTMADVEETYRYLRDEGHKEFDWVAVDSLSEIQKIMQKDWLDKNRDKAGKRHPDVLGIDGYQITQNQIVQYVKQMNDLPMHKLYTAWPMQMEDEDGDVFYLPLIHGGRGDIARMVNGMMKLSGFGTFHGKDDKMKRRIYFQNFGAYRGKDRYDAMGNYKDNLTLPRLEKLISDRGASVKTMPGTKTRTAAASSATKKASAPRRRRNTA